jgi:hypothetical protein
VDFLAPLHLRLQGGQSGQQAIQAGTVVGIFFQCRGLLPELFHLRQQLAIVAIELVQLLGADLDQVEETTVAALGVANFTAQSLNLFLQGFIFGQPGPDLLLAYHAAGGQYVMPRLPELIGGKVAYQFIGVAPEFAILVTFETGQGMGYLF